MSVLDPGPRTRQGNTTSLLVISCRTCSSAGFTIFCMAPERSKPAAGQVFHTSNPCRPHSGAGWLIDSRAGAALETAGDTQPLGAFLIYILYFLCGQKKKVWKSLNLNGFSLSHSLSCEFESLSSCTLTHVQLIKPYKSLNI